MKRTAKSELGPAHHITLQYKKGFKVCMRVCMCVHVCLCVFVSVRMCALCVCMCVLRLADAAAHSAGGKTKGVCPHRAAEGGGILPSPAFFRGFRSAGRCCESLFLVISLSQDDVLCLCCVSHVSLSHNDVLCLLCLSCVSLVSLLSLSITG